jgi:hypothetical protein
VKLSFEAFEIGLVRPKTGERRAEWGEWIRVTRRGRKPEDKGSVGGSSIGAHCSLCTRIPSFVNDMQVKESQEVSSPQEREEERLPVGGACGASSACGFAWPVARAPSMDSSPRPW